MTPQKYNKYFILPNIYYAIYINSVYFLDIKKGASAFQRPFPPRICSYVKVYSILNVATGTSVAEARDI